MDIVLVALNCAITEYLQLIVICDLSEGLLIKPCFKTLFSPLKAENCSEKKRC